MVTCYNLLFNAEVRLEKGEAGLRRAYHPDYNALLKLFPYEPQRELGLTSSHARRSSGPFAAAEEKAQRAIDAHSMYLQGVERNAVIEDAYMVLGKARYFQNKLIEALEASDYVKTFIRRATALSMRCSGRARPNCWPGMYTKPWSR